MKNWFKKFRSSEKGNVFTFLLGGISIVGILSFGGYQLISGPLSSASTVSQTNIAKNQLLAVSQIIIVDATNQIGGGDCDSDGYIEPRAFRTATGDAPTNGGSIPSQTGAPTLDPWGQEFGYCAWDVGNTTGHAGCGGAGANRLDGSNDPLGGKGMTSLAFAIISSGADKTFETTCNAYVDESTDLITTGGDDIVKTFSYQEAASARSGLWTLMQGVNDTAYTDKKIEVGTDIAIDTSVGNVQSASLDLTGKLIAGGGLQLGDQTTITSCGASDAGTLRYNTTTDEVQFCDGAGNWPSSHLTVAWPMLAPDGTAGDKSYSFTNINEGQAGIFLDGGNDLTLDNGFSDETHLVGETSRIDLGRTFINVEGQGTVTMTSGDEKITFGRDDGVSTDFRIASDGGLQLSSTSILCSAATEGTLQYIISQKVYAFCDGTNWLNISTGEVVELYMTVFVTSTTYSGNLGGISGADAKCQAVADAQGIAKTFKAWVADSTDSPSTTFTQSAFPYKLVDGTVVADNWADLVDGSIDNEINLDESGSTVTSKVWGGVTTSGGAAGARCNDWVSGSSGDFGRYGNTASTVNWTDDGFSETCDQVYPLYCFEQ